MNTETVIEPLLVNKGDAARLCGGISQRSIDRLVSCGKFPRPVKIGGRCLWDRAKLGEWIRTGCPRVEDRP
jgi:predicted DNA-binding transcriptional regulator AlpA